MPHDATGNRPRARLRAGRDGDGADCGRWAMKPTETLRAMLDECGVEWKEHRHVMPGSMVIQRETLWGQPTDVASGKPIPHVYHYRATEMGDGRLFLEAQLVTPEQAIAATLGRGMCHDKGNIERFICSECGCRLDLQDDDWEATMWLDGAAMVPNFCPNCGARVEVDA